MVVKRTEYVKKMYSDRNVQYQVNKWAYDGEFDRIMGMYKAPGWAVSTTASGATRASSPGT